MKARWRRPWFMLAASAATTLGVALYGGCQQAPVTVPVRSLERSGRVSFVCLGPPGPEATAERPLHECTSERFVDINSYYYANDAGEIEAGSVSEDGGVRVETLPHLYALVTQTTRGEVAVLDTSSSARWVLDQNPVEPGANFLPIGAQPTGIVSTPGSMATFVGVAEVGRFGIFVLPSWKIRPANAQPGVGGSGGVLQGSSNGGPVEVEVPGFTSWPACALPAAPGELLLLPDPLDADGLERTTCDGEHGSPDADDVISIHEKSTGKPAGRQKLIVTIPDLGGILVLDAQALYKLPAGSFDACPVERWIQLEADTTGYDIPSVPPPPQDSTCVNPELPEPSLTPPYQPRPAGIAYAGGTLYVADLAAPVVHVIDMPTPCEPVERTPLLPTSAEDPKRVVVTSRVAVTSEPTADLKRYLYATDVDDGSIMVFDVSPTSNTRRPLIRKNAAWNPFQPRDRVRYAAPVADLLVATHDAPEINPVTGIAASGVRCDPNPNLLTCTPTATSCDIAKNYQTDTSTYQSGAGPNKLRGTFAYAALTNGRLAVIDVDDFDAQCRGPEKKSRQYGCDADDATLQSRSLELSCNIVQPNTPRSAYYEVSVSTVGLHVPGLIDYPRLYSATGSTVTDATAPLMRAPPAASTAEQVLLYVAGEAVDVTPGAASSGVGGADPQSHTLAMNYEDPRAHVLEQVWTVTYEGMLPGFGERYGDLLVDPKLGPVGLYDPTSRFCDFGVQSEGAARAIWGSTASAMTDADWAELADYVAIMSPLPEEQDPYWGHTQRADPSCTFSYADCLRDFGTVDEPGARRDLRIVEAYQGHVELQRRDDLCHDGKITGADTDVDCGGTLCRGCAGGKACKAGSDCLSGACDAGVCAEVSCHDGGKNGDESDVDCGGSSCALCAVGRTCGSDADCASGACKTSAGGMKCEAAASDPCHDGAKDGDETDVDCGGASCRACAGGQVCMKASDCLSRKCDAGLCAEVSCHDGVEDGDESDVDCGGSRCAPCAVGRACNGEVDCASGACKDDACLPSLTEVHCCFPGAVQFAVRGGDQWITVGEMSGFFHHVVPEPVTGRCRNACDPTLERKTGRLPRPSACKDGVCQPFTFSNPMFRFEIQQATSPERDTFFRFTTSGAFVPLMASLSVDSTVMVQPQAMTFVEPTNEIAVTDGQLNGLIFVNLSTATFSRSLY